MIRGRKTFDWICRLFVVAVLGIILYSVIFEWDNYVTFFSQTLLDGQTISFVAFFENKNIFGMGLIFGFIASMYLHARYAKFWQIGFMIFFGIVSVVIDCRTAMVAEGIAFVAYMLCRFFMTLKKHPWRNSFAMAFFAFAALFILVPVLSPDSFTGFPFLANFGYLIQSSFLDMGTSTMSGRSEIWLVTLELIFENAGTAIFGMGGELINYVLAPAYISHYWGDTPVFSTHNGFLFVLAKFGIIGFIIYLVLLVLIVRKLIIWMRQGDRSCAGILFGLLVAMMHAIAENTMFFGSTTQMVAFLLLCIMPVLLKREEEERAKEPVEFHFTIRVSMPKAYYLPNLCLLVGVFFMAFAIASPSLGFLIGWNSRFGDDAFSYVVMAVLALVLPKFMYWIKKAGMAGSLFALVIYVGSLVACYYLASYISALICVVLLGIGVALTLKEEGQEFWPDTKKYLLTLLPFLVGGVVACTALCVIGYNIRMLSDYAVIALTVATVIAYVFVVFLTPLAKYSFPEWLLRLGYLEDRWLMKMKNFRERRKEKKEEEGLLPGVPAEEDEEGHQKYFRIYR